MSNMKRYLYLLLGAMLFAACEPIIQIEPPQPEMGFTFGDVSVKDVTESSAHIVVEESFITIDGERDESTEYWLSYYVTSETETGATKIEEYVTEGGKMVFKLEELQPNTKYTAKFCMQNNGGYFATKSVDFTTDKYVPKCEVRCVTEAEAKGIMATITLSDVAYMVDNEAQEIESVKLEYARKRSELEWIEVDVTNKESVSLPEKGGEYLDEKSKYLYRVTITPANREFEPITTEELEFETRYAEVTAEISKPDVAIVGDNVKVAVESVKVWFDGVERPDYHYLEYYVYYREPGGEKAYWENKAEVELNNGGISLSLALSSFEEGKEYEFAGAVVAGAERKVRLSDIVTITIPKEDTPTPPTPPTPPVGGSSDTTAIAGDWHLAEWRGAAPSFDVYMSITEDGVVSLWQRIESREWQLFYSTVIYENDTIWGEYTDGIAWGASYSVAIDGDRMTWTDTLFSSDVSVYERAEIPDEVTSNVSFATRSASERFF